MTTEESSSPQNVSALPWQIVLFKSIITATIQIEFSFLIIISVVENNLLHDWVVLNSALYCAVCVLLLLLLSFSKTS